MDRISLVCLSALLLVSCELHTREDAEKNTLYTSELDRVGLAVLEDIELGISSDTLLEKLGDPFWASDISKNESVTYSEKDINKANYKIGSWVLAYSKQKNPNLDFIQILIFIYDGEVARVDNFWYDE